MVNRTSQMDGGAEGDPPEGHRWLKVNGVVVGTVPITGDPETDLIVAREFLDKRGLRPPPPTKVQSMFRQAIAFATVSRDCHAMLNRQPRNPVYAAPFVVNIAFSIELYLKTLAEAHGVTPWGHDLMKLYEGLPGAALAALSKVTPHAAQSEGLAETSDVGDVLANLRTAFVDWRYVYEKESTEMVHIPNAIFVARALHEACLASGIK
ncbi:hypothetical protein RN01_11820 [Cupriavidus sp. SHE]|jgi:hypothetical protein|uniref:HEPN domain-containing protein n=2 Tax=Cupriavidus metallidurans TaxID=119219 RepID=A0A482IIM5_9BURK|nr:MULTISPECIES: hypothetical protein [Cupriavidus]KWR82816.1 hypothetical protein RN01_11820 [Cupriavidus sp. SHE]QBP09185.1 hypothetical protein DDF84_005120 [Cupriavidus metallidurans]